MKRPDCCLSIAMPAVLEEEVLDALLLRPDLVPGFTVLAAEGAGPGIRLASPAEQVRGRARRRLVQAVLSREDVAAVIDALRSTLRGAEVVWWVVPVDDFGRLS